MQPCVWILPLFVTVAVGQSTMCPTAPNCDTTLSPCLGYGDLSIKCPNGTSISYGACYISDLCPSVAADQGNNWIRITVNNINPKQCYAYSISIRQSLLSAYNTWCCQGDNYLKCCPGSIGWPSSVARTPANCAAMQSAATDIQYMGATGSAALTQFFLKLTPRTDSPLCQLLVYPTGGSGGGVATTNTTNSSGTAATTTTTTTTAAAAAAAAAAANTTTTTASSAASSTTTTASSAASTTTSNASSAASTTTSTSRAATTTVSVASGTTAPRNGTRRRRRDVEPAAPLDTDERGSENDRSDGVAERPFELLDGDQQSRSRRAAASSVSVTLNADTVRLIVSAVDLTNLVVSAVTTASNYTLSVTVTVEQLVAPAATLSPDLQSSSWVIATGTLCGIIAAMLVAYLIACAVYKSRTIGSGLPL